MKADLQGLLIACGGGHCCLLLPDVVFKLHLLLPYLSTDIHCFMPGFVLVLVNWLKTTFAKHQGYPHYKCCSVLCPT